MFYSFIKIIFLKKALLLAKCIYICIHLASNKAFFYFLKNEL